MLDAVYVEAKQEKRIVAIKPKPPFQPVFQVAAAKEGSGVMLLNEPPEDSPEARSCFWWRRGRVGVHLKHGDTLHILTNVATRESSPILSAVA